MNKRNIIRNIVLTIITTLTVILFRAKINQTVPVLYFYNWSEYIPDSVIKDFTEETGIKVFTTTYESNESMFAKMMILKESGGYDLVVPSTYYVEKLYNLDMLHEIDKSKITNISNINPLFLNKEYDPNNKYSIPYFWGTTLIAVNSKNIDIRKIKAWKDLWNPEYKNKIMLMNDIREVFHIGLVANGFSGNSTNPEEIEIAYKSLQELFKNVAVFSSDTPSQPYISGDVEIGMIWNGSAYTANKENPNIKFIYPEEGAIMWIDNLVIPKNAANKAEAHQMINFLLRPDIAARIAINTGYATPNQKALNILPEETKNNEIIYPSETILQQCEIQKDVGNSIMLYNKYWNKLRE